MPKISERLEEVRARVIIEMFRKQYSAQEIGKIFGLTTSTVYNIIKANKIKITIKNN